MKKIATFLILFLAPFFLQAQFVTDYKSLADKAFAAKDYYAAAVYYQKITGDGKGGTEQKPFDAHVAGKKSKGYDRAEIYFRLAESYRLFHNYVNAEPWYFRLLEQPEAVKYPHGRLWYGVCLRANQHFDEAIRQLQEYLAANHPDAKLRELARKEIVNCRFAQKQYQFPKPVTVIKIAGNWNSDGSNYSLKKTDSGSYWFTSSRFTQVDLRKNAKSHLNRIFFARKNSTGDADVQEIQFAGNTFAKDSEWGTPAFTQNGRRMYFTLWFKQGNKVLHAIYLSNFETNKVWSAPQKLNINVNIEGFNAIQPFITKDDKYLYFASNKPGSMGGYDLWMSELDTKGNPVNSINLGKTINTEMDEQAPYYNEKHKKLIYSSKGFAGLGGFDFMESLGVPGKWGTPENMGYPMNSAKDDLYFAPDPVDTMKAYISSDRQSDCCLDVYTIISVPPVPKKITYTIAGLVVDCETLKPVSGAQVSLPDSGSIGHIKPVFTNAEGRYQFELSTKRPLKLLVEQDKYFTRTVTAVPAVDHHVDTLTHPQICLNAVKVGKAIVLKNILFDYKKATLRPVSMADLDTLVSLMKENPKIKIELSAHTDAIGSDSYNLKLSQSRAQSCTDYLIKMGIEAERIIAKGYGKNKPVAPNTLPNGKDNPSGRQLNRRTEFTVL